MATNHPKLYDTAIHLPITSHRPPEPFGKKRYKQSESPGVADISPQTVGHLSYDELMFARHPRERHEPSLVPMPRWFMDNLNQRSTLEIIRPISQGPLSARLVLCKVHHPPNFLWRDMGYSKVPEKVVAKIFDPLYYQDCPDPVAAADREYAEEAAAYYHLHAQREKPSYASKPGLVPHFYGTWTTDITADHLVKSFKSTAVRKAIMAQEAKERAAFDTASASTNPAGASPQTAKLEPKKFRPVRIILMEYIKGLPLSHYLVRETDDKGYMTIRPRPKFESEAERLEIMGSIMDTVSRIEHLGVTLQDNVKPSSFIIVETPKSTKTKDSSSKYHVVMCSLSEADVTRYTHMGYGIAEKLPLPMLPLSSRGPLDWHLFTGWIPDDWLNKDGNAYDTWGESHFDFANYTGPEKIQEVCDEIGWEDDMRKAGNLPHKDDDPEWQQILDKAFPDRHNVKYSGNFKTKTEYDKFKEDMAKRFEAERAAEDEEYRQNQLRLVRKAERSKARREKREADEREAERLRQSLMGTHLTESSTDAPSAARPASSSAGGDLKPGESSQLRQPVEFAHPQPRDSSKGHSKKPSRHVREGAVDEGDEVAIYDSEMYKPRPDPPSDSPALGGIRGPRKARHVREGAVDEDDDDDMADSPMYKPRTGAARPTRSVASGGYRPSEPSQLRQHVEVDAPMPAQSREAYGKRQSRHVREGAVDEDDDGDMADSPMYKPRNEPAPAASSLLTGRLRPDTASLFRQAVQQGATTASTRRRGESSSDSHSTTTESTAPSLSYSAETASEGPDPSDFGVDPSVEDASDDKKDTE